MLRIDGNKDDIFISKDMNEKITKQIKKVIYYNMKLDPRLYTLYFNLSSNLDGLCGIKIAKDLNFKQVVAIGELNERDENHYKIYSQLQNEEIHPSQIPNLKYSNTSPKATHVIYVIRNNQNFIIKPENNQFIATIDIEKKVTNFKFPEFDCLNVFHNCRDEF
jgi:hypothetical protein